MVQDTADLYPGQIPVHQIRHEDAARAMKELRAARRALQASIMEAKVVAAKEMTASLDGNPWGRSYMMAMAKLRSWAPPIMESLDS